MNLYAESSAVLAWLLGAPSGERIRKALARADMILASDLTLIECDRVLIRAHALNEMSEVQMVERRSRLNSVATHWTVLRISPEVVERARRSFPVEPIRTLDAIHVATALLASSALPDLSLLTLDDRIRAAALQLGLTVSPK